MVQRSPAVLHMILSEDAPDLSLARTFGLVGFTRLRTQAGAQLLDILVIRTVTSLVVVFAALRLEVCPRESGFENVTRRVMFGPRIWFAPFGSILGNGSRRV